MRDYITPLGGYLVIGGLVASAAGFYAVDAWYVRRIRAKVAQREAIAEQRPAKGKPSPIAIRVVSDDPSWVTDMLIEHTGGSAPLWED